MRILIVEDDLRIAGDIAVTLEASGYLVTNVHNGEDAWFLGDTEPFDLIILDLGLPRLDGLTVLKRWRSGGLAVPVLILTARGAWSERVEGIDAGADDYLTKPFHMEELQARVRALIRRSAGVASPVIQAGNLTLDTRQMRVTRDSIPVNLTPLEYRLTSFLIHHMGRVVPAGELLDHLYGDEDARDANALEAVVTRLRRKLGTDVIETRRGFGYVIVGEVQ